MAQYTRGELLSLAALAAGAAGCCELAGGEPLDLAWAIDVLSVQGEHHQAAT